MKLGLLAYSTKTGLGVQTFNLYKYLNPYKIMVVDLSDLNRMETNHGIYKNPMIVRGIPKKIDIDLLLNGLDVIFVCETPLNYYLFDRAKELGIKIVLQPNWEFYDYNQSKDLTKPDLIAAPSLWHFDEYEGNKVYLPVPYDDLEFQEITKIKRFLHIAGRPAVHDRNGTIDTINAFHDFKGEATLTIRCQNEDKANEYRELIKKLSDDRITVESEAKDYKDMYKGFDAMILPRRYGGLCLPMNEAIASGLPVIMTDIEPNNLILPQEWLVTAHKTDEFMTRSMIDIYTVNTSLLTLKIYEFVNADEEKVKGWNNICKDMRDVNLWKNIKDRYLNILEDLCQK